MSVDSLNAGQVQTQDLTAIRKYAYRAGYHLGMCLRALIAIVSGNPEEARSFLKYFVQKSHQGFCIEVIMALLQTYARRGDEAVVRQILGMIEQHRPKWHGHALALVAECNGSEVTLTRAADEIANVQEGGVRFQGEHDLRIARSTRIGGEAFPDITPIVEATRTMDAIQRGERVDSEQISWYYRLRVEAATAHWFMELMKR